MNRHQVLTGATNSGDDCFAVGSVEGVHFTAYAAGTDIVVLASDFQRVQIIPGAVQGSNVQVSCIDCCTDAGKIAASYGRHVCIFEPTPLLHHDSSHKLDYQWYHTGTIETDCEVFSLSWNQDGVRLLTGGDTIQMWHCPEPHVSSDEGGGVEFFIEDRDDQLDWTCIWHCRPATPVYHLKFSADGLLFASVGKNDRLVKIWYENKQIHLPLVRADSVSPKREEVNYSFVFIAHPRAVTGFQWRKTSKYMPRGSVANMLITSCKDNICRLWCETILPEDGLVDVQQLDPNALHGPMYHTQRHKKRFVQQLHHIRNLMHKRKVSQATGASQPVSSLPSSQSVHDFHKFGVHPNSVAPGFHFHLAASINPDTDIPLLPALSTNEEKHNFVVHWLNNKELHFTMEAEKILEDLSRRAMGSEDPELGTDPGGETHGETESDDTGEVADPTAHTKSMGDITNKAARQRRGFLHKSHSVLSTESEQSSVSMMSVNSAMSHVTDSTVVPEGGKGTGHDPLDRKIETLLKDWHQSADMLYSIHPLDGSFLVWLVEWLDEPSPGSFRQAQVSFSSRIPQAIPVGDAMTMSPRLLLYCNYGKVDIKAAMKESESKNFSENSDKSIGPKYTANAMGKNSPGQSDNTLIPNVLMLSKHDNGSLNIWQISFAELSKFSTVLSVAHASRACGHRFQTNCAACHSVLPLLLTTSHHNAPEQESNQNKKSAENGLDEHCGLNHNHNKTDPGGVTPRGPSDPGPGGFCSELILWRVDPVGPLSKSGGITELARINSPQVSAFSNVAWLPTLLPSSTLGTLSNSPSALFVASDGISLRLYQAVVDARSLLTEETTRKKQEMINRSRSNSSVSSGWVTNTPTSPPGHHPKFNVVSQQSTSRPGCIIEVDTIKDAKQDWQHIQLIHVFQEQLVYGQKGESCENKKPDKLEPMVDLQGVSVFEETFYLVVVEKLSSGSSVLHMWKIVIASQETEGGVKYTSDVAFYQDMEGGEDSEEDCETPPSHGHPSLPPVSTAPRLVISTTKVCTQNLELPERIQVVCATVAAGHLSSSSIYPACFAPYLISTACSDGRVRFWKCRVEEAEGYNTNHTNPFTSPEAKMNWTEWEMMIPTEDCSSIRVPGKPITVSCAYSGRVAVAYRLGGVKTKNDNPESKYVNLCVSIYECESTGGSEWSLEDTIELKNISIPDPKIDIDLSLIYDNDHPDPHSEPHASQVIFSPTLQTPAIVKTVPIPSPSTVQSVKKKLSVKNSHSNLLRPRHLVQLDWMSTEDGSHVLTVAVGPKILLYAAVSTEISAAQLKQGGEKPRSVRGMLQKSKSMTVCNVVEDIRWMKVRNIELGTADGLPPLPMHISWVRDGLLVVGMDNEMHVYSQWKVSGEGGQDLLLGSNGETREQSQLLDTRTLTESSLHKASSSNSLNLPKTFKISPSMSSIKMDASISNLSMLASGKDKLRPKDGKKPEPMPKSESLNSMQMMYDCGLFEAARLANPVLPQYHPKQLIELLNFGKVRRVKAILAHLVRCIAGGHMTASGEECRVRGSTQVMSVSGTGGLPEITTITEEDNLDYMEITSIPPLPLYALLAADDETAYTNTADPTTTNTGSSDYNHLFTADIVTDELEDPFDGDDVFTSSPRSPRDRKHSASNIAANLNYFGPGQSRLLARHLTYTQLPGLSSLDQMYLLALADTVANTKLDLADKNAPDVAVKNVVAREQGQTEMISTESIDDCGLRFLLASRHYVYLMNTLPIGQRAQIQKQGLSPAYFVWAFHSEAEEELLNVIPSVQKGEPTWAELSQFGVGWWLRNINTLRRTIEKVAKTAFLAKKNPLDAALFYLAMKKKAVLWGLFRSVSDAKMVQFFRNNFSEDRWRKAALKNAFALLGRQRFHHAAAFFLLAGSVRDAIEVCLNKLDDLQLGMVLARLYETDLEETMPPNLKRLLHEECLGCDAQGQNYEDSCVNPDPFIRSMAYWHLNDYSQALGTLLDTNLGMVKKPKSAENDVITYTSNPSVFNFYNYLRTHPLLVRQHLATTAADKSQTVLLSGFSRGAQATAGDKNVTYVDRITPIERRLYFTTAHAHFKNGCPILALEVLSKLPEVIDMDNDITKSRSAESVSGKSEISTGTLNTFDKKATVTNGEAKASDIDWSTPVTSTAKDSINDFDWSQPVTTNTTSGDFDWSQPVSRFPDEPLKLSFDSKDDLEDNNTKSDSEVESKDKLEKSHSGEQEKAEGQENGVGDIMAQQLKFIACLKIMMEELSTLATGFEVDGGQLRIQLYIWLEKGVEVLHSMCYYRAGGRSAGAKSTSAEAILEDGMNMANSPLSKDHKPKPTLHEVILAEKMDFEAKLERMARRKQWLRTNQQLLRTLLSYSVLHGSCGGGLASVRMELILLLQELQQEKTQQQLLSPLPFPTTLPLLSASVASAKTVIADPIRHLQSTIQDLLHSIIELRGPPTPSDMPRVMVLRNLSAALSACIYQCLCDSDSFVVTLSDNIDVGMEGFTSTNVAYKDSYLMAGAQRRRYCSSSGDDAPNSQPSKWPGVSSLRALLAKEKDEDAPKLNILLCEALISVYMSLFVHAFAMYDANILYRLVGHTFAENMWPVIFGGGVRKLVKCFGVQEAPLQPSPPKDEMSKQRMKLHMKILGQGGSSAKLKEDKPTYKEKFVPPEQSMIGYFMTKPYGTLDGIGVAYDSSESLAASEEEDEDEFGISRSKPGMEEHLDPNSYSWCLMRYAICKFIHYRLRVFLPQIGIELPELPVCSPMVQSVIKCLEQWEAMMKSRLEMFSGPPDDYVPSCFLDLTTNGPTLEKYKPLMDPNNTPFLSNHYSALPAKRLWHYLVNQDYLHDVFIRYVFRKKPPSTAEEKMRCDTPDSGPTQHEEDPMKIIHKEQDIICCFAVNQYAGSWSVPSTKSTSAQQEMPQRANLNCISMGTPKEVVEMDVAGLLSPPIWLEDETEYDIQNIHSPSPSCVQAEDFLVVQTPADKRILMGGLSYPPTAPGVLPAPTAANFGFGQSGRGGSVLSKGIHIPGITNPDFSYFIVDRSRRLMRMLSKRSIPGVRRMGAHPHLPYYLTGAQDGSVRLWEWGHQDCISVARQPGSFPKVTKVLFNAQGNKFGVADGEGSVCLWQVGLGVNMNKPYLSLRCHNKSTSDFVFVGSSSLLATSGHSSENRNVCLWDTLLPQKNSLVQAFHCHQDGSPAILYAPQHQVLISAGKKGDICLFDVRQRQLRHSFQAHDSVIKCLAINPSEEYFVTGSADGDIKVWGLSVHNLVYSFPGEHPKGSIFRNVSSGVTQVYISPQNHLFSCGADGSMKVRQLPKPDELVHSYTGSSLSARTSDKASSVVL